jgi:hypothetical protein
MHHRQQKNHYPDANGSSDEAAKLQSSAPFLLGQPVLFPQILQGSGTACFGRFGNLLQQIILVVEFALPGSRARPGRYTKKSEKCNAANAQPYKYGYVATHNRPPLNTIPVKIQATLGGTD